MNTRSVRETILTGKNPKRSRDATIEAPLSRQALQPRHVTTLKIQAGTRLEVKRGVCWLTSNRDTDDIILKPGQSWEVRKATEFLGSALGQDSCVITITRPYPDPVS